MPLKGEVPELLETKQFTQSFLQKLEILANPVHQSSHKKLSKKESPAKSQKSKKNIS